MFSNYKNFKVFDLIGDEDKVSEFICHFKNYVMQMFLCFSDLSVLNLPCDVLLRTQDKIFPFNLLNTNIINCDQYQLMCNYKDSADVIIGFDLAEKDINEVKKNNIDSLYITYDGTYDDEEDDVLENFDIFGASIDLGPFTFIITIINDSFPAFVQSQINTTNSKVMMLCLFSQSNNPCEEAESFARLPRDVIRKISGNLIAASSRFFMPAVNIESREIEVSKRSILTL